MADNEVKSGPSGFQIQRKTAKQSKKKAEKSAKSVKKKFIVRRKGGEANESIVHTASTAPDHNKDIEEPIPDETINYNEEQSITFLLPQRNRPKKQKRKPAKSAKKKNKLNKTNESAVYIADTAPGDKKDIAEPMPDKYSPKYVEAAWYAWWEKQGFFKPEYGRKSVLEENPKGTFVMVIPPPNVIDSFNIEHAYANALQDVITRWHRMNGRTTLWIPGYDYEDIVIQDVCEKLFREEKKTRHELDRDELVKKFMKEVRDWKEEKCVRNYEQLRSLGMSYDWSRVRFTTDPSMCRAVNEAFIRLHDDGDIYRANRLVNWSCKLRSAISDIEVDKVKLTGRTLMTIPGYEDQVEFGVLVFFAYKTEDTNEEVVVATIRVETMLADVAVAVHPNDERYKHLIGKNLIHPIVDRKLPIIADDCVDMNYRTGAMKIAPAHDPNDYEIGKRHDLPLINILDDEGKMLDNCGPFAGMKRFDVRPLIIEALNELHLYKYYEEDLEDAILISVCRQTKDVVESLLRPQWYIKCDKMASDAIKAVKEGELKIFPDVYEKIWYDWTEDIGDWCISRQLWWGLRIPAYTVTLPKSKKQVKELWVSAHTEEEALTKAAAKFKVPAEDIKLQRDEDVLDTWFSAGLFTFSIFGWPDQTDDLQAFYPGTLLEAQCTNQEILFTSVARMMFFGQRLLGKLPFKEIYVHPKVGEFVCWGMSKSMGIEVEPMDVVNGLTLERLLERLLDYNLDPKEIERFREIQKDNYPYRIPECGSDALRLALCAMDDINRPVTVTFNIHHVNDKRYFCNILWETTKHALMFFPQDTTYEVHTSSLQADLSAMDRWMLSRLALAVHKVNAGFAAYDYLSVTSVYGNLWRYDIRYVYLGSLKPVFAKGTEEQKAAARRTLYTTLEYGLKLLSPFMPFLTEELYQRLPRRDTTCPSICVASYPTDAETPWRSEDLESDVKTVLETVSSIEYFKQENRIYVYEETVAYLIISEDLRVEMLKGLFRSLQSLADSKLSNEQPPSGCHIVIVSDKIQVHLAKNDAPLWNVRRIMPVPKDEASSGDPVSKDEASSAIPFTKGNASSYDAFSSDEANSDDSFLNDVVNQMSDIL